MKICVMSVLFAITGSELNARYHGWRMMDHSVIGLWGMGLLSLLYFAILSCIFSVIFWLVYKWLVKK